MYAIYRPTSVGEATGILCRNPRMCSDYSDSPPLPRLLHPRTRLGISRRHLQRCLACSLTTLVLDFCPVATGLVQQACLESTWRYSWLHECDGQLWSSFSTTTSYCTVIASVHAPTKPIAIFFCPASKGNRPMVALIPHSPRGATKVDRAWQNRAESMANHYSPRWRR